MSAEELFSKLFGKKRDEAESIAKELGYTMRVIRIDGKPMMCTRDFRIDRINVRIVGGILESHGGIG